MPGLATPEADRRLDLFLDHVTEPLRNDSQRATFAAYAVGLLSDAERKSMGPLAAWARPDQPGAAHKAFCYLTSLAVWDDAAVRRRAAAWALWGMTAHGPVLGTIGDDTGILKQGGHLVGVARQYTGSAGKVTNCQIAVTLAVYSARHAVPIDTSLYLPESWIQDPVRRKEARIPEGQAFVTKGEIALAMLKAAHADAFHSATVRGFPPLPIPPTSPCSVPPTGPLGTSPTRCPRSIFDSDVGPLSDSCRGAPAACGRFRPTTDARVSAAKRRFRSLRDSSGRALSRYPLAAPKAWLFRTVADAGPSPRARRARASPATPRRWCVQVDHHHGELAVGRSQLFKHHAATSSVVLGERRYAEQSSRCRRRCRLARP
jgi:hypothetical protein